MATHFSSPSPGSKGILELGHFPFQPLLAAMYHPGVESKDAPHESVSKNEIDVDHAMPPGMIVANAGAEPLRDGVLPGVGIAASGTQISIRKRPKSSVAPPTYADRGRNLRHRQLPATDVASSTSESPCSQSAHRRSR